ncbi:MULTISPECIES: DUF1236 domain-containing protein [Rhizobium/Agrobacterium group]|uniref:DUF1236 domain-containing protein n=2 Tax=Neorhizobium TaxID=1525371 RepID=A0ABV0M0Q4_9HYPH|nr:MULTISPECIES: DUF1236 domain-containing protein [Rhizobium/Agrobacterium group]KGD99277.1 hypothetical protein JL39_13120 [Rhizobium sp. YS-1r]MCC2609268.1 DUF1236 domain-containing protein [Neorhizobium petrolearium]WGI69492.1 DUF1236 domain-containing protein [Neorhizobium petrolearium]
MHKTLAAVSAALIALSGAAYAQTTIITKDPAVTGSTTMELPGEVRTYVMEQTVPSVTYDGTLAVGTALPDTVEIHTIQDHPDYAYTVVNEQRVVVNPQTRTVIQVLE